MGTELNKRLLLVEDDLSLGTTLSEQLINEGYLVLWSKSKADAMQSFKTRQFDLVLLDIGLPDGSGLDLARDLRFTSLTPIIFLTAMNSADYRLEGLEIGAEDFIPKPFFLKELLLKIQRVLGQNLGKRVGFTGGEIDMSQRSIRFSDGSTEFPSKMDFALLTLLIEKSPAVVSREELCELLRSGEKVPNQRSIDNAVVHLRQLFARVNGEFIRSVRGVGYQWIGG